jgi:Zn-dependent peptidase ImmA (M78 family)/DNA-binding XRE family transcriptional regulator
MDAMELARRVVEGRQHRGLTQGQLAQAVGMDRTVLAKIESGQRRVTALELVDLARELGRRTEWFLLPRVDAVTQHRYGNEDYSTLEIDVLLEELASDVALLVELGTLQVPVRPQAFPVPGSLRESEDLGGEARRLLNIADGDAVLDLTGAVYRMGLVPFAAHLGDGADAASLIDGARGIAVINSNRAVGRRRLALAHELGHFLIDDQYTTDFRVDSDSGEALEGRMDRFARSFLLPAEALREQWSASEHGVRGAAVRLASAFRVDMSTLARRLQELGMVDHDTAQLVRGVRTTQADIIELDLLVPHDLEDTFLPREYQRAVLRAYKSEDISSDRALSMLRGVMAAEELPQLQPLEVQSLWSVIR